MKAVLAIARNTFREALRDRVLYLFLGFAIVLLATTKIFGMLTVGNEGRVIRDFGLAGIQFFSMLISVMMSITLISREVENRTIFNILAKPVRRWQFLLGKYLGLLATIVANLALMTVILIGVIWVYQAELDLRIFIAAGMLVLEMAVVAAFATLFAVLTKAILGAVFTLAVFVIGHISEDIWELTKQIGDTGVDTGIAVIYYLLPNLERFNFKAEIVHGLPLPTEPVVLAIVYATVYSSLVLLLACVQLERKDLV